MYYNQKLSNEISAFARRKLNGLYQIQTRLTCDGVEVTVVNDTLGWPQKHQLEHAIAEEFGYPVEVVKIIA